MGPNNNLMVVMIKQEYCCNWDTNVTDLQLWDRENMYGLSIYTIRFISTIVCSFTQCEWPLLYIGMPTVFLTISTGVFELNFIIYIYIYVNNKNINHYILANNGNIDNHYGSVFKYIQE